MVRFVVDDNSPKEARKLVYVEHEYAVTSEPWISDCEFEIIINRLALCGKRGRIIQINGIADYKPGLLTSYIPPHGRPGALYVSFELDQHGDYNNSGTVDWYELPVFVNAETDWICIGHPTGVGVAVEFMENSIAVINEFGELVALWIKPEGLPRISVH